MTTGYNIRVIGAIAFGLAGLPLAAHAHGISIGRNSAGQLTVHIDAPQPFPLGPSPYPGITGHANAEPGITAAELDEPDEDLFQLSLASDIQFIYIGSTPGLQIVTSHAWVPGETTDFGPPFFDFHLIFNIPNGVIGQTYFLQFRLHDHNGVHADSDVFTLSFTPVVNNCTCRGDFDDDHARTGVDIQSFLACALSAGPDGAVSAGCECADMDADGAMDETDLEMFVVQLLIGEACN